VPRIDILTPVGKSVRKEVTEMSQPDCSGHCVVTEYRETNIVLTTWSGTTDDGRTFERPIDPKWKFYPGWLRAFVAGLASYWVIDDDCCDDCSCDTSGNTPGPWHTSTVVRRFRQPVKFPGYKEFFIHGTYTLEYRFTEGICSGDPGDEGEGSLTLGLGKDEQAMGKEAGVTKGK
jgi:hypothetical protein